ncbi:general transcription factor 3C polypeptide 3-like isoform X3 [Ananas comosus]|uniref:General transcription factor 3C polypeptide 3-like isoform X3 n=1 Tax=Ananas comosus TaxID=4615 RepID=A0A6P5G3E5_ANACO|nr:general transcription factor 3C polypeptide 3-like isoform X3 [Ananas comosus]
MEIGEGGGSRHGEEERRGDEEEQEKENEEDVAVEEEEEEEEEGDDEEYAIEFDEETNPLDFIEEAADGVELYQQFERLEYEALAERKRKALQDRIDRGEPSKKPRRDEFLGATMEEINEMMNFGMRRRNRSRAPKKRGRKKGSRNKFTHEVSRKIGDATLHYASGDYEEAIPLLEEVVLLAPNLPDAYHLLGLIYEAMGDRMKAINFHILAAYLSPKDPSLWKKLVSWSIEQKNSGQLMYCLKKAITADPNDVGLKFDIALLQFEMGEYKKAAESYEQILEIYPANIEARKMASKMYRKCGLPDRAISLLEDHVNLPNSKVDLNVVDLLVSLYMDKNAHNEALRHIENARLALGFEKLPASLNTKAIICHAHLGEMEPAEVFFQDIQMENSPAKGDWILEVADSFASLGQYDYAVKLYSTLEEIVGDKNGKLYLKVAQCYISMKESGKAIPFFYKALSKMEDDIAIRLTLASVLVEEGKEDETIILLSPPKSSDIAQSKPWWLNGKIKLQLAKVYRDKGMLEAFADTIFPSLRETLIIESMNQKVRPAKKLPKTVLFERAKLLGEQQPQNIFHGFKPIGTTAELAKAARAKKLLQKKASLRAERKAAAIAAGLEWQSEDSEDETPRKEIQEPPLPGLLMNMEGHQLILDLCKALASLKRYREELEIINRTLKVANNALSEEKKEELRSLGAQIAYSTGDPKHGYNYVRHIVQQHPYSNAAWNCFYKVVSRVENRFSGKFLNRMKAAWRDCVPPIVISGHHFTAISQHQAATRDYLEAYKLQPDNPLINLCVGISLINLALGFRLQNKHQCVVQGFAFLYNYLRICDNSQEALYNVARAYHQVGLVTLAAAYYEKVLAIKEEDHPIPKLPYEGSSTREKDLRPGYSNLHREAAYNLHLIYKKSGATDLARQDAEDEERVF